MSTETEGHEVPAIPQAQSTTLRQQLVDAAIQAAKDSAGKPYTPNGRTTAGFDCSGFVTYVYKKVFPNYVHLNTDAIETSTLYKRVTVPRSGDLIFFTKGINPYDKKSYPNHVGIMLDTGTWVGSQTSTGVARVMLTNPWWSPRTKRFLQYTLLP
jgi:cell wall-associated NlpC family hydrolase